MHKIIFLDVDGPLIPTRLHKPNEVGIYRYVLNSNNTLLWDREFIRQLVPFCIEHQIDVVFNTTHNYTGAEWMRTTAITNGMPRDIIHPSVTTRYPDDNGDRVGAIMEWLDTYIRDDPIAWMCIDDYELPIEAHLLNVTIRDGMTQEKINELFERFREMMTDE